MLPEQPAPSGYEVGLEVDVTSRGGAISPFIYGTNEATFQGGEKGLTLNRVGGNRWSAYNWENNASNAGTDWSNQNDAYLGGGSAPGGAVRERVALAHAAGAAAMVTVPLLEHVAADKNGDGDVAQTPSYLGSRFARNQARKDGALSSTPDLGDGAVYQDEFVAWLEGQFPSARGDARRTIFYSLDNEPDLWSATHPRVHPQPVGYDELVGLTLEYAAMVKDHTAGAVVVGPVNYGWEGMVSLQGAPDGNGRDFLDYYLSRMHEAAQERGERLVDVLDVHWYPEARGGGVRIIEPDASPAVAAARVQAPRSLWDPSYVEDSWIVSSSGGAIALLPRLRDKIDAHAPGMGLAVTEYNYGGGGDISGGLAQADVLGVFGREGVFAAAFWPLNGSRAFIDAAFQLYRNYDGAGATFGSIGVPAGTSSIEDTSVYASVDPARPGKVFVVAINKTGQALSTRIALRHTGTASRAEVYRLTSAATQPQRAADLTVAGNAADYEMPAMSASLLVFTP